MSALALVCTLIATPLLAEQAVVLEIQNIVQTAGRGKINWSAAAVDQKLAVGDRIRTRQRSRATVGLTGLYTARLDQFTTIEITPGLVATDKPKLDLSSGAAFLFSREKDGEIDVRTPAANAALRGTQLYVRVETGGRTLIQVLEGSVELDNPGGKLRLAAGEAGLVSPGQAPRRTAVIEARNLLQWALYYPAVLDPSELGMSAADRSRFARSLAAYGRGDLLGAVRALPPGSPGSLGGRLFQAGALLAVGRADDARALLRDTPADHPGRRALERLLAAAAGREAETWDLDALGTASEALAESYYLQSRTRLAAATAAARRAVDLAPENGFAWTRLAELEFSAGRTRQARAAIARGEGLTPDNARTHALRGFILCAENRIDEGRAAFERSVKLDGSFGNGWLGLGLTRIRQGDLEGGRAALQTATTVEPATSLFHSYLAKAMSRDGRREEAAKDLALARMLDPADPTPPLYQALEDQLQNRTNSAIGNLEESIRLNDNRRLFRSGFLLDQDRAVRSANLARIYQNAGMRELAVREATRAVESDYTNASAHLFLANSFDALRDPNRTQLRYETPWFNELLLANLLSPVGGGPLSQFVSQQEYSKLLESDGPGGSLLTEWRDRGDLRTTASTFGTQGNLSYGLDYHHRDGDGDRPNNDIKLQELYGQIKWQATPDDIVYFLGKWSSQTQGDLFETHDNRPLSPDFRFEEDQKPGLLLGGWNHRWAPGSHTLLLAGRLSAEQRMTDPSARQLLVERDTTGMRPGFLRTNPAGFDEFSNPALRGSITTGPDGESLAYAAELLRAINPYLGSGNVMKTGGSPFAFETRREFTIHTGEIQHIQQWDKHTMLLGGRHQDGEIETISRLTAARPNFEGGFSTPAADQRITSDFQRNSFYLYDYWNVARPLTLIGGISWDRIDHPANFRNPPISDRQVTDEKVSGKLGFTYAPSRWFTLRGLAAEGMGGLTYDESVRLEPTQLAGFNQAWRTVISESLVGSVEAPHYQTLGLSLEGSLPSRTWWGLSAGTIDQSVRRELGIFTGYDLGAESPTGLTYFPDGTRQHLDYLEQSVLLTVNQLIGEQFAVGALYRLTRSELETRLPDLAGQPFSDFKDQAILQEVSLFGNWYSPSGWFARVEANWYDQSLKDDPARGPNRPGDEFIHFNAWAGYRFRDNLCELTAGLLNIGNTGYQLNPLNPRGEIARERTFLVMCRLSF